MAKINGNKIKIKFSNKDGSEYEFNDMKVVRYIDVEDNNISPSPKDAITVNATFVQCTYKHKWYKLLWIKISNKIDRKLKITPFDRF